MGPVLFAFFSQADATPAIATIQVVATNAVALAAGMVAAEM